MEQLKLKAIIREERGTQASKKLRNQGLIPAIVYHHGDKSVSVSVNSREFAHIIHTSAGENALISLTIDKEKRSKPRSVIIKEVQHHPVKRGVVHIDFNEISLTEKITVMIQLVTKGEAEGVKNEGGVLDNPVKELQIECLPTDIPPHLDVDVSGLKLNDSIHIKDLVLPAGVRVLLEPEALVFQVKTPVVEKEEEALKEAGEVEVITEKKEEEGAEGEKAPEAPKEPKAKEGEKPEKK